MTDSGAGLESTGGPRPVPKGKIVRLIGVDLGQQRDYSTISVTEQIPVFTGRMVPVRGEGGGAAEGPSWTEETALDYHVRHLERPPLGTSYTRIVDHVIELIKTLGGELTLVVDATGVGRPVVDMFYERLHEGLKGPSAEGVLVTPAWVTITGGDSVSRSPDGYLRVPKRDLVSAPLVLMQNGRLKVADELELKDDLLEELKNFRIKINIATAHDSYEAWREGDHDDLVLSVALGCWTGQRFYAERRKGAR